MVRRGIAHHDQMREEVHMDAAKPGSHMQVCRVVEIPMRKAPTEDKRTSVAHRATAHVAILPQAQRVKPQQLIEEYLDPHSWLRRQRRIYRRRA